MGTVRQLRCGDRRFALDRPLIMGVVNVTPDSFSDGGCFATPAAAIAHCMRLIEAGADIIDVGGESTRPGASAVSMPTEQARVLPVVKALVQLGACVSIDTRQAGTMRAALDAGAHLVNDVSALRTPGALEAVAGSDAAVCLMHMQGEPGTMQQAPYYDDVVEEVRSFLHERAQACLAGGIAADRILVDPGFGFGKTLEHNLALLRAMPRIASLGWPILVGLSRKSMVSALTGRDPGQRLAGSLALAQHALGRGASVLRVHDVAETRDLVRVWQAVEKAE